MIDDIHILRKMYTNPRKLLSGLCIHSFKLCNIQDNRPLCFYTHLSWNFQINTKKQISPPGAKLKQDLINECLIISYNRNWTFMFYLFPTLLGVRKNVSMKLIPFRNVPFNICLQCLSRWYWVIFHFGSKEKTLRVSLSPAFS